MTYVQLSAPLKSEVDLSPVYVLVLPETVSYLNNDISMTKHACSSNSVLKKARKLRFPLLPIKKKVYTKWVLQYVALSAKVGCEHKLLFMSIPVLPQALTKNNQHMVVISQTETCHSQTSIPFPGMDRKFKLVLQTCG